MMKEEEEAINISDDEEQMLGSEPGCVPTGSSPFDVQVALNIEALPSNEAEGWTHIHRRLNKFFEYGKKMRPGEDYFRPRWEIDTYATENPSLPTTLLIYGVDYIRLRVLGKQLPEHTRKSLNESNCLFVFASDDQALVALTSLVLDPTQLAHKQEEDGEGVPRGWFELKPYVYQHKEVKMWGRFAVASDLKERKEEPKLDVYKDSRQIFNEQEEERQRRGAERQELFNERRTINKQKNSEMLYEQYQKQNSGEWKEGINENPGAHRERSRSRSNEKSQINNEDKGDNVSNYSFVLRKAAEEIEKQVDGMQLSEVGGKMADEGDKAAPEQAEDKPAENGEGYQWEGAGPGENGPTALQEAGVLGYRFSYQEYMRRKEEEEEKQRQHVAVTVIELDD